MTVATTTTTVYSQPMRRNHISNYVGGKHTIATNTLSDIIFLCKIPNGAVVTNWHFRGTHGDTTRTFKLGITGGSAASETAFGTQTWTTGTVLGVSGTPFKVSISDSDAQGGATVYMTVSTGTWTTSASFEFSFEYRYDVSAL
jgi:hypothetical protein